MKILVTAKPRANQERVEKIDAAHFKVWVKEPAQDGRANKAIIRAVAEYLDVAPSKISIISGITSKHKILEIYDKN